ncbi:hypothetical protein [Planotetraspora sp. GP83]|uniref:hypothetical protein n=1 Tax=Planotetraspora sp. GP83 TaxID=3156264 RepID=UPI0035132CA1
MTTRDLARSCPTGARRTRRSGTIILVPAIPESTKTSLAQCLHLHARQHWPQLAAVHVRYHGQFGYVEGRLTGGDRLPLMRLRYGGSAHYWGLAIHNPGNGGYEAAPWFVGTPKRPST